MGIPTWAAGQVLTASDVNTWFVPLAVVKTADESVTSSTTLQNDDVLVLAVAASATYQFECYLDYEGGTQGSSDLKTGFTVPAGTTMRYQHIGITTAGAASVGTTSTEANQPAYGSNGAGTLLGVFMVGTVKTSTTAGNVQLQWAQNTSSGTATIVHAQSYMRLYRLA